MTGTTHLRMHGEHRLWESDIGLWRDELCAWQHELAKAQGEIKQLEKALADHAHVLRTHASALRLQEQKVDEHEHAIVEYEKGGEGDELFQMARDHSHEAVHHAKQCDDHQQLKRRHHEVIAHWNLLLKALRELAEAASAPSQKVVAVRLKS
jgi:hypothetical protein